MHTVLSLQTITDNYKLLADVVLTFFIRGGGNKLADACSGVKDCDRPRSLLNL